MSLVKFKTLEEILLPYTFSLKFPQNTKVMFGPGNFEENKEKKIKGKVKRKKKQSKKKIKIKVHKLLLYVISNSFYLFNSLIRRLGSV